MWPDLPARSGIIAFLPPHSAVLLIEPKIALGFSTASLRCRFVSSLWSANLRVFLMNAFCQARPPHQPLGQLIFWRLMIIYDSDWKVRNKVLSFFLVWHLLSRWWGLGGPFRSQKHGQPLSRRPATSFDPQKQEDADETGLLQIILMFILSPFGSWSLLNLVLILDVYTQSLLFHGHSHTSTS